MMSFSQPWKRISTPRPRHLELSEFFSPCRSGKTVRLVSAPSPTPSGFGKIHGRNTLRMWAISKGNHASRWLDVHFIWIKSINNCKTKPFIQYMGNSPRPCGEISNNSEDLSPGLLGLISLQGFFNHLEGLSVLHVRQVPASRRKNPGSRFCWKHDF